MEDRFVLGISAFYHDSAACIVKNGEVFAAAQEERFTRKKHDERFPEHAIAYCLKEAGITAEALDCVAFYEKPLLKFERLLETYLAYAPRGIRSFLAAMPPWLKQKLWMKSTIADNIDYKGAMIFPEHHESHAASAFFPSPFRRAAFLTIDGVGEWTTTSWGIGENNRVSLRADLSFPHSLGLLYSAFTYYTGFKVNSAEYKVMGLAPYGKPRYKDVILRKLVDLKEDGSLRMDMDYFDYCTGLTMTNKNFDALFGGPPRRPEAKLTQREMDLAASVQAVTEEAVLRMARHIKKETGEKYLCLAGGVALNAVANGKLLEAKIFDDLWIQPAAGDAGGALGAALCAWHEYRGNPRAADGKRDAQKGSLLGPQFNGEEIREFLKGAGAPYHELTDEALPKKVAELINGQNVIGWFQGRMEFGPRALGNRSIIGDARSPKMQEVMNVKIKFRESFRPFAPSVLWEKARAYFDLDRPAPYMITVANVVPARRRRMTPEEENRFGIDKLNIIRSDIPAVTHVDYSARVQTVDKETNPRYHALIEAFDRAYGCPVIINTSFNVRGEPIVCTPEDAYRCFMRTNMDCLALGNFLLFKKEQPAFAEKGDWKKEFALD